MHIKRFQAPDINKALEKVKEEFGDDAIILKTNRVKKRDPYTNQTECFVEILAAIDYEDKTESDSILKQLESNKRVNQSTLIDNKNTHQLDFKIDNTNNIKSFNIEIGHNKTYFNNSNGSILITLYEIFSRLNIDSMYHNELTLNFLRDNLSLKNINLSTVYNWTVNLIKKDIILSSDIEISKQPTCIAIIGPTGSGKTLTTAKLAAELKFHQKRNIAMVSYDNYKLGAIEHLKRYAEIMDIPFYVAKNLFSLKDIIKENITKDVILIDTFGKSLKDVNYYTELKELFNIIPGLIKGMAILPSNYSSDILKRYIDFYLSFPLIGWTVTKIDEISNILSLLMILRNNNLKVCFFSDGQKIPENLIKADINSLNNILEKFNTNFHKTEDSLINNENIIKKEKSKLEILREIQA